MKTNLQFFADPSNDPEPTDPKPTSNDPAQDPKDPKPSGKTYTQDDIGKMMAAKAKEVESNLKDDFEKELKQKEQEWLEKGEKRAGMNASEKAQADLKAGTKPLFAVSYDPRNIQLVKYGFKVGKDYVVPTINSPKASGTSVKGPGLGK